MNHGERGAAAPYRAWMIDKGYIGAWCEVRRMATRKKVTEEKAGSDALDAAITRKSVLRSVELAIIDIQSLPEAEREAALTHVRTILATTDALNPPVPVPDDARLDTEAVANLSLSDLMAELSPERGALRERWDFNIGPSGTPSGYILPLISADAVTTHAVFPKTSRFRNAMGGLTREGFKSGVSGVILPMLPPPEKIEDQPNTGGRAVGHVTDAISPDDAIVKISLKDVPRHAWKKVRAELAYVLKVAVETGGKATVLRPLSKRRVAELPESTLQKKRERERKNMATYRQRLRAKAAGSPQP